MEYTECFVDGFSRDRHFLVEPEGGPQSRVLCLKESGTKTLTARICFSEWNVRERGNRRMPSSA